MHSCAHLSKKQAKCSKKIESMTTLLFLENKLPFSEDAQVIVELTCTKFSKRTQ